MSQQARLNGVSSNVSHLHRQIPPQRCVLSPLSFHRYINECQTHHDRQMILSSHLSLAETTQRLLAANQTQHPWGIIKVPWTLKRFLLQADKMDEQDFGADVSAIPAASHDNKGFSRYPGVVTAAYSPHLFHGSGGGKKKFPSLARLRREPSRVGTEPSCSNMEKKNADCFRVC